MSERKSVIVEDSLGEKWTVRLTLGRCESIREITGEDVVSKAFSEKAAAGKFSPAHLFWLFCSPDAQKKGLDKEAFLDRFDGADKMFEVAGATVEILTNFFQNAALKMSQSSAAPATGKKDIGPGVASLKSRRGRESKASESSHSEN